MGHASRPLCRTTTTSPLAYSDQTEHSGHMTPDDDDRGPEPDGSPVGGEPFDWDDFVVPDDARELEADIRAYRRERRAQIRTRLTRRLLLWNRLGPAGPIVVGTALLLVSFVLLMVLFPAPAREMARPDALATPTTPVGEQGGLVPDVRIRRGHGDTDEPLRAFRPAVIMLLPAGCVCADATARVVAAAQRHRVLTVLVGPEPPQRTSAPDSAQVAQPAEVIQGSDASGSLAARYELDDPTDRPVLLVVRSDGVINRVLTDVPSENALDGEFVLISNQRPPR